MVTANLVSNHTFCQFGFGNYGISLARVSLFKSMSIHLRLNQILFKFGRKSNFGRDTKTQLFLRINHINQPFNFNSPSGEIWKKILSLLFVPNLVNGLGLSKKWCLVWPNLINQNGFPDSKLAAVFCWCYKDLEAGIDPIIAVHSSHQFSGDGTLPIIWISRQLL